MKLALLTDGMVTTQAHANTSIGNSSEFSNQALAQKTNIQKTISIHQYKNEILKIPFPTSQTLKYSAIKKMKAQASSILKIIQYQ